MFFSQESLVALEEWKDSFFLSEREDIWRNVLSPQWRTYWQSWFPYILDDVDWSQLKRIDNGSYGVVFATGAQTKTVVRLAYNMDEAEIERQNHFARQGKSIPVFDYASIVPPPEGAKLCCPQHGVTSWPKFCTCHLSVGAALMPRVEDLGLYGSVTDETIQNFMDSIYRECHNAFQFSWEPHERNIALFQGELVAIDFGDVS